MIRMGIPYAQMKSRPLSAASIVGKEGCRPQNSPGRFSAKAQAWKHEILVPVSGYGKQRTCLFESGKKIGTISLDQMRTQ